MTKTFTIIGAEKLAIYPTILSNIGGEAKDLVLEGGKNMSVSDGYHTMDDLYEHRISLWIAYCRLAATLEKSCKARQSVWRSKLHSDGTGFDGWFVLGMNHTPGKQITYHLPMSKWAETDFAKTYKKAPEFDGHTSDDVLIRLKKLGL